MKVFGEELGQIQEIMNIASHTIGVSFHLIKDDGVYIASSDKCCVYFEELKSEDGENKVCKQVFIHLLHEMKENDIMKCPATGQMCSKIKVNDLLDVHYIICQNNCRDEVHFSNYIELIKSVSTLVSSLMIERNELLTSTIYDKLTGVYSRNYFEEKLKELEKNRQHPITIVTGDVNNLKLTNDIFGHGQGDLLIKTIADIMRREAKDKYIIGRCGGDEINILMPDTTYEKAKEYCNRVKEECSKQNNVILPPSIAFGVYEVDSEEESLDNGLSLSEDEMYKDKVLIKGNQNLLVKIQEFLYDIECLSESLVRETIEVIRGFAFYLQLDYYSIADLSMAARIQDIGMVISPKGVTLEEYSLSEHEIMEIKKHPEIGYRIAKFYDESFAAANTILQSHECWNGSGYPQGLKGTDILLSSRILHIATTFTKYVHPKPHGYGLNIETALNKLYMDAGEKFDPNITEKFILFMEGKSIDSKL